MEPPPAPGLEDSSLHRYLDGEFWSLKNELCCLLGGCPLFRHRYRAAAGRLAMSPWSPRALGGTARGAPGQGQAAPPSPVQMMDAPRQRCGHRTRPRTSRTGGEGGFRLHSSLLLEESGVKGWAGSGRLGAPLTLLAGRFGSASRPQLLDCPPIVSHPGWWEKGQKNWDEVGVDGARGHRAVVSRPGARELAGQRRPRGACLEERTFS